jgi:hypothetical protein
VAAFFHPIPWFLETVRQWRRRTYERRALAAQLADDDASADIHNEINTLFWYLPPPC